MGHTPVSLAADMRMWVERKPELQAILSNHIPHHQIGWMWTSTHIEHAACEFRKQIANSWCNRKWPEIRVENIQGLTWHELDLSIQILNMRRLALCLLEFIHVGLPTLHCSTRRALKREVECSAQLCLQSAGIA